MAARGQVEARNGALSSYPPTDPAPLAPEKGGRQDPYTFPLQATAPREIQWLWVMSRRVWRRFTLANSHPGANSNSLQALKAKQAGTAAATIEGTGKGNRTAERLSPGRPSPRSGHTVPRLVSVMLQDGFHSVLGIPCPFLQ